MIKILFLGDSNKDYKIPIKEYEKRLQKKIEIVSLKASNKDNIDEIIKDETKTVTAYLSRIKDSFVIIMSINGQSLDSLDFASFLAKQSINSKDIVFVIGGAYGLDYNLLKPFANYELSLSSFTFNHNLALLVLLEQIYRRDCINIGKKYHY